MRSMSSCPIFENSHAVGPVSSAISCKSAPAEKKRSFPAISNGARSRASSEIFLVSDITQSRVRRFVPSSDTSRSRRPLLTHSSSNLVTDILYSQLKIRFAARATPRGGNHLPPIRKFPLQNIPQRCVEYPDRELRV